MANGPDHQLLNSISLEWKVVWECRQGALLGGKTCLWTD